MPSQNTNGGRGSPWPAEPIAPDLGSRPTGQNRLKRLLPGGGPRGAIVLTILALVGLGAWTAYYTVPSDSVAVVQRFGKYLKDVPPGLHFKLPLGVDTATIVPVKRQLKQEFGFATLGATDRYQSNPRDGQRETEMVTGDLNAALVEWVLQYRISDPFKCLFDVRDPTQTLRDALLTDAERDVGSLVPLQKGRKQVEKEIYAAAAEKVRVFGIELLDIRFKRINCNESVRPKIYDRMISERRQIAESFLSEGNGEAATIRGKRVRDLNKIQSEAYRQVEEIRGVADAKATEIYARACNQSPQAVAFYEFTRTMQAYKTIIEENTTLVLSTDSELTLSCALYASERTI